METRQQYIFTSERLGFREWQPSDLPPMAAMNADPAVMEFFPAKQSAEDTKAFIGRMEDQFRLNGYCYYAVDRLDTDEFIGFIGLMEKTFEAEFTPCVDIGWRLATKHWNLGFATEGALRCIEYGFETLRLQKIVSMAPPVNTKSIGVMKKIGMHFVAPFHHPALPADSILQPCHLYQIINPVTSISSAI